MAQYEKCPKDVRDMCTSMMRQFHDELHHYKVAVDLMFAYAKVDKKTGLVKGPALKLHGYQCAAVVKVVSLKDRAKGMGDAEILIDGDRWPAWTAAQRRALLDHELEHLVLVIKQGKVQTDDLGRPELFCKLHDYEVGGFRVVADRHGDDSFELMNARTLWDNYGQALFPWAFERTKKGAA